MTTITRTLRSKVGLLTLALVVAFFLSPSASPAKSIGSWGFSNLWAPKTFGKWVHNGGRVQVKIRVSTLAAFNPTNRTCRLRVSLVDGDRRVLASRLFRCNNSRRTFTVNVTMGRSNALNIKLFPADNARFQGVVEVIKLP